MTDTMVLRTMWHTWGPMVASYFKTADGCWIPAVVRGKHCFKFTVDDPRPAFFKSLDWRDCVRAALTKAGFCLISGNTLHDANEISTQQFEELGVNKTIQQWWRKEHGVWKPKTKWTKCMVTCRDM